MYYLFLGLLPLFVGLSRPSSFYCFISDIRLSEQDGNNFANAAVLWSRVPLAIVMIVEAAFLLKGGYLGVLSRWCFLLNVGGGELLCMHTPHPHPHPLFADAIGTTGFCQHAALKVQIWIEKFHGKVCGGWHLVGGGGGGGGGIWISFSHTEFHHGGS